MKRTVVMDSAALVLLGSLPFLLLAPVIFGHQAFYFYDVGDEVLPLFQWSHHCLAAGIAPLWDGSTLCGYSQLDASHHAFLYPPFRLALTWFDGLHAFNLLLALHLALAAWGAYALVRARGLGPGPALLGAVTAAFCGGAIHAMNAIYLLVSVAFFPWMLLGLELCWSQRRPRRQLGAVTLGLATGLSFLGGYPGMAVYALGVLALLLGLWILAGRSPKPPVRGLLSALALAALLCALIYGGQAEALERGSGQSARGQGLSLAQSEEGSLSPAALGGLLLPHALGRRADDSFTGDSWRFGSAEPIGAVLYLGLAPLLLLLVGLSARRREAWPWAVAWGALLFYALGRWNPAYPWLLKLPVLGYLRAPAKAMYFSGALAALPVAYGAEALAQRRDPRAMTGALGLVAAMALMLGALTMGWSRLEAVGDRHVLTGLAADGLHRLAVSAYLGRVQRILLNLRWHLAWQAVWAVLLALALGAGRRWRMGALGLSLLLAAAAYGDLAFNGRAQWELIDTAYYRVKPATVAWVQAHQDPRAPTRAFSWGQIEQLRRVFPQGRPEGLLRQELAYDESVPPNTQRFWGLDLANGYASMWPARQQPLLGWVRADDPDPAGAGLARLKACRRALDLAAARWVISALPLDLPGLVLRRGGDVRIYENLRALPMAYIATRSQGGYNAATAWDALSTTGPAAVRDALPALLEDGSPQARGRGTVRWVARSGQAWDLDADVDGAGGILVMSLSYYRGPWKARVDGLPARILPVNAAFCGLRLASGRHHISMRVDDPLVRRAQVMQSIAWSLAAILLAGAWFKRKETA